jgi:hypothetical protein
MNCDHFVSSIFLRDEIDFAHRLDFVSFIWLVWDSALNHFLFVISSTSFFVLVQLFFIYRLSSRSLRNHYLTLSLFNMTSINNDLSISSHVKKKSMYCYDAYNVRIRLVDNWKQKRVFETMFYVLNKIKMSNIILELSKLKQIKTKLNYQMFIWRYDFSEQILKISLRNDFAKKINYHDFIYVVMIQSYKSDIKIKINAVSTFVESVDDATKKMFFEFKNFDDVFSLKNEKILTSRKKNVDHVIELKNEKQSSYEFLYNLFNIELKTFRLYLDDALSHDIIKHSINSIETSMFFVFKKNEKLRLCVNYRDFNKITRKNHHFLSLIIQMLNHNSFLSFWERTSADT